MGGNPDAAALVGIPVKRVTLMLFALLAVLVTIAAIVSIARLNAGTNSLGTGMELYVIAAGRHWGHRARGRQRFDLRLGAGRADQRSRSTAACCCSTCRSASAW